jgi:pyruvate kinase
VNQLCLVWGVQSRMSRSVWDTEEESGPSAAIINVMIAAARDEGLVRPGMRVVVTGGLPLGLPGSTNFLQVVTVPE